MKSTSAPAGSRRTQEGPGIGASPQGRRDPRHRTAPLGQVRPGSLTCFKFRFVSSPHVALTISPGIGKDVTRFEALVGGRPIEALAGRHQGSIRMSGPARPPYAAVGRRAHVSFGRAYTR